MKQYIDLIGDIMIFGEDSGDRTGTGTRSIFGHQARYDLSTNFPLMTIKRLPFKAIAHELLWFLRGDTNTQYLQDNGVTIWDEWADENLNLGPVYGKQWRSWETQEGNMIDQIANVIGELRVNPKSRRLIVSAWNVGDIPKMALPPCHMIFQFYVREKRFLDCHLYQRSGDVFLGVPFNIASYALLTYMIAQCTSLYPGQFIHTIGDAHIYSNHMEQCRELLRRQRAGDVPPLPKLTLNPNKTEIDEFTFDDFDLQGYKPLSKIEGAVSI